MSIYEKIESAAALVNEARLHGFSTKCEDVIRAQDIFGHSTEEQLSDLATGKDSLTFYLILKNIWDTERVFRFWNQHNNPEHEQLMKARKVVNGLEKDLNEAQMAYDSLNKKHEELYKQFDVKSQTLEHMKEKVGRMELEIMSLKAKLYDYLTSE